MLANTKNYKNTEGDIIETGDDMGQVAPTSLKITKDDEQSDGKFLGQQGAPAGSSICPDDDRKDEVEPAH